MKRATRTAVPGNLVARGRGRDALDTAGGCGRLGHRRVIDNEEERHGPTSHAVHRPVGRPAAGELAEKRGGWGFDGLELACWGDHFDVAAALRDAGYVAGRARAARAPRPAVLGDQQPPRRPGRVRSDRRAPPGRPAARGLGRRRPGGRAPARRRGDEGHRPGRGAARRQGGQRLHRLGDLAPALLLPARTTSTRSSAATRTSPSAGTRSSTSSRPRACGSRLEVHPTEIAYDFVTTRKALDGHRQPRRLRHQLRPEPPRHQFLDSAAFIAEFARPHLPRPRQGLQAPARRALGILGSHLNFGEPGARLGLRLARPRRRRLRGDLPRPQPHRLRGAALGRVGRLRAWTATGARPTRSPSCAAPTSRRRRWPSTPRSRRRPECREVGFATMAGATRGGDDVAADRRRDARLRLHGQGPRQRLQDARLHDLAAAARAASWWRSPGRNEEAVAEAARRYGFATHVTDWRAIVADDRVGAVRQRRARTTSTPSRRSPPPRRASTSSARSRSAATRRVPRDLAARRGRRRQAHVRVQLPLRAGGAARARDDRGRRARRASTTSAARYLQEWGADRRRRSGASTRRLAGSGALGDLGAHVIDLARYLVGEIDVGGRAFTATFQPGREVDDAFEAVVALRGRRDGHDRGLALRPGRKNAFALGDQRHQGLARFDLERLNELQVHLAGSTPGARAQGFRTVLVSEPDHPFWEHWWPQGHIIGWEHTFVHELHHLLDRDPRRRRRRAARRDLRGRLPRRRGLRRDAALGRGRRAARPSPTGRRPPSGRRAGRRRRAGRGARCA